MIYFAYRLAYHCNWKARLRAYVEKPLKRKFSNDEARFTSERADDSTRTPTV